MLKLNDITDLFFRLNVYILVNILDFIWSTVLNYQILIDYF